MKSLRFLDRRVGFSLASIGLLLGMVVPAVFPAFASAAQITSRSVALSDSGANASSVTYDVKFTVGAAGAAGAFVVDFCNDSPIIGQTCTKPTGFNAATVTTSTAGATVAARAGNGGVVVTYTIANNASVDVELAGLHNPTLATDATTNNGFYARIITYGNATDAGSSTIGAESTGHVDSGAVAMSITNDIGVTAAVRETMTFCVSHAAPAANCTGTDSPAVVLGHGTPQALDAGAFDTYDDYTQISTNAASGAVVNLKNSNDCGGLKRGGTTGCDIAPAGSGDPIAAGTAKFGLLLGTPDILSGGQGTIAAASDFAGTGSNYGMTYTTGTTGSGVSSSYGAELYDTSGTAASNVNVPMTFAASASNTTPAGTYQATLSLIATGTY